MTNPAAVSLVSDESGSGPLAVLIHGITENRHSFDPIRPALSEHFRVVAVDLRGHGESPTGPAYGLEEMAADVDEVVDRVAQGELPLMIGHSLGGIVASVYGARYPVAGVVNIDQSLQLGAMQGALKEVEPALRSEACGAVMAGMFGQMEGALSAEDKERLAGIRRTDQNVVLGVWSPLLESSAEDLAVAVDELVTPAAPYPYLQIDGLPSGEGYSAWLRERIPGALVEDWGLLGHYPHLVEPERFVARVAEFAASL